MRVETISRDDFLKRVSPLDCFFTHGKSAFNKITDALQKTITHSENIKVNHTGLFLNLSVLDRDVSKIASKKLEYEPFFIKQPFIMHMSINNAKLFWNAVKTLIPFWGTTVEDSDALRMDDINKVLDSIKNSQTDFYWAPLKNNPMSTSSKETSNKLNEFIRNNPHIPYEQNVADALNLITGTFGYLKQWMGNDKNMICSELVTRVYQHLGLIDKSIDPNLVYPSELLYPQHSDDEKMKKIGSLFGDVIYKVI